MSNKKITTKMSAKKLAIHNPQSGWPLMCYNYCITNNIECIVVDGYDTEFIDTLKKENIGFLIWIVDHTNAKDTLMARSVLYAVSNLGIKTFPDYYDLWHFDDKISQKYLLESISINSALTHVFYDKQNALKFIEKTSYPLVAKLRKGSGARNVVQLKNEKDALVYIKRMFSKGIMPIPGVTSDFKNRIQITHSGSDLIKKIMKIPSIFKRVFSNRKKFVNEKGYVYFQEFIPHKFDIRIEIIGNKAWGCRRYVRKNDFRASGSDNLTQKPEDLPTDLLAMAFQIKDKLNLNSVGFDFLIQNKEYKLIEMSYAFGFAEGDAEFYYDRNLVLHTQKVDIGEEIVKLVLNKS